MRFPWLNPHYLTLFLIAVIVIWVSSNIHWAEHLQPKIVKVDGNGYYAYLPAIFIYHDLHFGFFEEIASRDGYENMRYEYRYVTDGKVINKYYAGTALALAPFFLIAHSVSSILGLPADGYSSVYLIFINLAAVFYLLAGCYFIGRLLATYSIPGPSVNWTLILIVFGTNLFYYTAYEPSMSHVYSFGFISIFLYFARRLFLSGKKGYAAVCMLVLGVITLIRPVNAMIVLASPFLAGSWLVFSRQFLSIFKDLRLVLSSFILFLLPVSLQFILYKLQTGHWWVYSYGNEGFDFTRPHIIEILFSYRKGLFIYTPILFVSMIIGGYYMAKESLYSIFSWVAFFLMMTYVLSSWEQWYYGGSFSGRVYVEYLPLFAVMLGYAFKGIRDLRMQIAFRVLMVLLLVACIIQTYQYYIADIHWSDMDKEKYWEVFMMINRL